MPYIKGGGAQKDSGLPAVEDVFHANDVYINNVLVAILGRKKKNNRVQVSL